MWSRYDGGTNEVGHAGDVDSIVVGILTHPGSFTRDLVHICVGEWQKNFGASVVTSAGTLAFSIQVNGAGANFC